MRLLRLFTLTSPDGRAGVGLLLLRAALGATSVIQGGACLSGPDDTNSVTLIIGVLAVVSGISLLVGCLTPVASLLAGLSGAVMTFTVLTDDVLLDDGLLVLLVVGVTAAVVLLGPGAFSLDARLFGRREIIIPHASRAPKL